MSERIIIVWSIQINNLQGVPMFKLISLFSLMFSLQAGAVSPHPCTPTRELQPMNISCKKGSTYYTITVKTLASRSMSICPGKNYVEYQTAYIEKSTYEGKILGRMTLYDGQFLYKSTGNGDLIFKSRKARLDLKNCVSPLHGAFSIGN